MDLQGRHVFLLSLTLFSFLLPIPAAVGVEMDDKPLLHEIRNFPTTKGKTTDLSAEIVDYSQFSSCLLLDEGPQLKGIEAGYGPHPKNIMNEVFIQWMEGKGKSPVSWRTLISCLETTGLREIAKELRKKINGGSSVEDGDGGGDSGTFKEEETTGGGHGVHISSGSSKEDEQGYCSADEDSGDCYPIKEKKDLFDATQDIGKWKVLCEYLGVKEGVLEDLDDSGKSVSDKKHDCLADYYKNHNPNWRKVVSVVANFPIRNLNEACNMAKKYMKMEREECEKQFKPSA